MSDKKLKSRAESRNPVLHFIKENGGVLIALLILVTAISIASENFLTVINMKTLLLQITTTALLGMGLMVVLIAGYIDLSIGATFAFSSVFLVKLMASFDMNFFLALALTLLMGAAIGAVIGIGIQVTQITPFIFTLAAQGVLRGCAYLLAGRTARVSCSNEMFQKLANGSVLGIPMPAVIIVIFAILLAFLLNRTSVGRHMYASGGNQNAAIYSGVNVKRICVLVYTIMGTLTAMAGCIAASRVSSGQPSLGSDVMNDAIAAAVLGGTAFSGGKGTVLGTMLGVLFIGVTCNALNLLEVNQYWQYVFKGLLILMSVYIDNIKQRSVGRVKAV